MRITPLLKNIENILNRPILYYVPKFQRSFSWDSEQVQQFWEDIKDVFYNPKSNAYFLGFILLKSPSEENENNLEIIDGQQRLAVLTIFFACLRDIAIKLDQPLSIKIQERYLEESDIGGENKRYKLKLNKEDDDFFACYIQKYDASLRNKRFGALRRGRLPKSHGLIKKAFEIIRQEIEKELDKRNNKEEKINFIRELASLIVNKFQVIETEVDDEADAYLIFETLNDRGIDLSISDLLKNYLYSKAEKLKILQSVQANWEDIVRILQDHNITNFIRHFWNSYEAFTREKELYQALKTYLKDRSKNDIIEFTKILKKEAEIYLNLLEPTDSYWKNKKIIELLKELNLLNVKQVLPILLSGCVKFNDDDFVKLLNLSIILSFRYSTICGLNPNKLEENYSNWAIAIRKRNLNVNEFKNRILELRLYPKDEEFVNLFATKEMKSAEIARYLLAKIEGFKNEDLFKGEEFEIRKDLTLEHIMPRKPEEGSWPHYDSNLIYRIGNLTLLTDLKNKKGSNKSFKYKCENIYNISNLKITKSLIKSKVWNENEIVKRQKKFAEFSKDIWKL